MSECYIGQIAAFGFNFPPRSWAVCGGQILSIQQNQALFSLLGTTYGGNGVTTFALPDLRSRTPIGYGILAGGGNYFLGQSAGVENVTLLSTQIPAHNHSVAATNGNGSVRNPNNAIYASTSVPLHGPSSGALVPLNAATVGNTGGNFPHTNVQPYETVNFCIALQGIFPARN